MGKVLGARGRRGRRLALLAAPVALLAAGCNVDLGSLGGTDARGLGVNDAGAVVGSARDADDRMHAFRKEPGAPMVDLNGDAVRSSAEAVNAGGVAVGYVVEGDAPAWQDTTAVAWQPDGTRVDLGLGVPSSANDINDAGVIVGGSPGGAFVREPSGHVTVLPDPSPSTARTTATAINEHGDVVGYSFEVSGDRPVLWEAPDYVPVLLPTPTTEAVVANDINDDGTIVGTLTFRYTSTALLWRAGTHELVELQGGPSAVFSGANAINDAGQVAGYTEELTDTTFVKRAVRWDSPDGLPTRLGGLGGPRSDAYGINELGDVVGHASLPEPGPDGLPIYHAALFPYED